ncbi:MAG: toll/interleukin-1 receptor domain-containing protein [Rubrivivax sp.]
MAKPMIFISHSHSDWRLAKRLQEVLRTISGQGFEIGRSSEEGAIKSGENWRDWIDGKVLNCDLALVVLTPGTFRGRWVLWEAGAVAGVQYERTKSEDLRSDDPRARRVRVLQFGLDSVDLGPFGSSQAVNGLAERAIDAFLTGLLMEFQPRIDQAAFTAGIRAMPQTALEFVAGAQDDLRYTPTQPDEGVIQEWLHRLDAARERGDYRWAVAAKRWINVALLGAGNADAHKQGEAVDFRVHTRIAECHRRLDEWHEVVEQLRLAAKLSPNDLVVLRELGQAFRQLRHTQELERTMQLMEALDAQVFRQDREAIALRCGYFSQKGDWVEVEKLLSQADASLVAADSYLANWRAVASMKVKGITDSRPHFEQLRQSLSKNPNSFWDGATLVNALLALGEHDAATRKLAELRLPERTADDVQSASRFYDEIVQAVGQPFDWRAAAGLPA